MRGRDEDKIAIEKKLQAKVKGLPDFMRAYYLSLNEKTGMTKLRYMNQIIRYLDYIGKGDPMAVAASDLSSINADAIMEYVASQQYNDNWKEMSAEARAQMFCSLNSFFTFLTKRKIISENPFENKGIERPRTKDKDIIFLEPEEWSRVKSSIMSGVGTDYAKSRQKKWMYRDLLLMQLPIITGVRVTCLSEIALEDIDFDRKIISVIDKNRPKKLYLDNETFGLLEVWIANRKDILGDVKCPYLFVSERKKKMCPESIGNVVKKYTRDLDKHITAHKLRATCATNLYRASHDVLLVAEVLGHSNPQTTRKYTKVDSADRQNASDVLAKFIQGRM